MDFVAQAAGTPADQALQARGPDHDLDTATTDSIITVLGDAFQHRIAVGGRSRFCYSSLSGALSGHFFTRDPVVLARALHGAVPSPAKLLALWQHQVANGLDDASPLSIRQYLVESETITTAEDLSNLPAVYLLSAADLFDTEVPAGALGGQGTLWLRSAEFRHVGEDVPHHPGLVRLKWLGMVHYYAPGIFHTATRDLVGQPYRVMLETARAASKGLPYG